MTDISPLDYTARDYATVRAALLAKATELMPEWTGRSSSDFGVVLVELFAYAADQLSYYGDRIVNEAFIDTAVLTSSVMSIANMLGYRPDELAPANGSVTFTVGGHSADVTIPAGTIVANTKATGDPPVYFETDEELVIVFPATSGEVAVTEGVTTTDESLGTSTGQANAIYTLYNADPYRDSIQVYVDAGAGPVLWTQVLDLIEAGAGELVFSAAVDENGVGRVYFGDGTYGAVPDPGATITATYRTGQGTQGNVAVGAVNQMMSSVEFVTGVTNDNVFSGGQDAESLESIRRSAPLSLKALSRAVTLEDFASLALNVPGVAKAAALAAVYTAVDLYVAPTGGGTGVVLTADLITDIEAYFEDKKQIGVDITVVDAVYFEVNISATVQVLDNYQQDIVELAVETALNDLLAFENLDFGQTISRSMVYAAINSVVGVDYAVVTLMERDDDPDPGNTNVTLVVDPEEIATVGTITLTVNGGL